MSPDFEIIKVEVNDMELQIWLRGPHLTYVMFFAGRRDDGNYVWDFTGAQELESDYPQVEESIRFMGELLGTTDTDMIFNYHWNQLKLERLKELLSEEQLEQVLAELIAYELCE